MAQGCSGAAAAPAVLPFLSQLAFCNLDQVHFVFLPKSKFITSVVFRDAIKCYCTFRGGTRGFLFKLVLSRLQVKHPPPQRFRVSSSSEGLSQLCLLLQLDTKT